MHYVTEHVNGLLKSIDLGKMSFYVEKKKNKIFFLESVKQHEELSIIVKNKLAREGMYLFALVCGHFFHC